MVSWIWISYVAAVIISLASISICVHLNVTTLRRSNSVPRVLAFVVAMLALALALASPVDRLSERLFSAHMIEHELLLYTVPVALQSAYPMPLAIAVLRRLPLDWRRPVGRLLNRHPSFSRTLWRLVHPASALMLSSSALWAWHVPPLYDLALRNEAAHALEHICFLATAFLYWRPLLMQDRYTPALNSNAKRALYLIAGGMQSGLLGALITLTRHVIYTGYLGQPFASTATVLADQQIGGAIMWLSGPFFCGALAAAVMRTPASAAECGRGYRSRAKRFD
jgi:putative membrane protein